MKKLQKLDVAMFKNFEAEEMKKIQGGLVAAGTWTLEEIKITSGGGNDSSANDCETPAHDDGKDSAA